MIRHRQFINESSASSSSGELTISEEVLVNKTKSNPHPRIKVNRWILLTCQWFGFVVVLIYCLVPIFIAIYPTILSKIIFLNNLAWPPFLDLTLPKDRGLPTTSNFYLTTEEQITVGVWHVLASSLAAENPNPRYGYYEHSLKSGKPIILYFHGNAGTRGGWHRVQLYKVLRELDYHVIAVDYRGYGDSTGIPSEDGICHDAKFVYKWVKKKAGNSPIIIWGHSLGTGVTVRVATELLEEGVYPTGILLESPFNNIQEAATYHPFALLYKFFPFFKSVFLDGITKNNITFKSDEKIGAITPPVLILHAGDDFIVPIALGKKLYKAALMNRPNKSVPAEFIQFNGSLGYGHKHIHYAPDLPQIVTNFVTKCISEKS